MNDAATDRPPPPTHAALGRVRLLGEALREAPQTLAAWWRGAAASRFPDDVAFHGHDGTRTIARYPEVHYRWLDGAPALFSFGEAAQRAMGHPWPGSELRLGPHVRTIAEVQWNVVPLTRGLSRRLVRYEFRAPWLALNQANYGRYRTMARAERRAELDRILVGNLLSMSTGFGWFFEAGETVYAAADVTREVACTVKDTVLVGFEGSFVCNLELPDHLALGRSVSHGFGCFVRA